MEKVFESSIKSHIKMRDESRLSEANIPPVTLDAAPNHAEEEQVPYAASLESEAPANNLAKPNSEENIPLATLDAAPNHAEEEQVPYAAARESEAPADNLAKQSDMDRIKRPWSPEEDDSLQNLVQKYGPRNWSLISKSIPGRTGKSCWLRWLNHLSPQVEDRAFTPEEDDTIIRAHARFGNKWATIAGLLNGRTDNAIKNHWNSTLKLKLAADNLAKPNSEEWIFLVTSLCMEILSAACDQASSPSRPRYALFGMLLAIAALLTCICELIYKGRKNNVVWRKSRCCMLFGLEIEIFGLVGGIAQCVCSTIQYVYYIRHAENPIKLSLLPAMFLVCLIATRLSRKRMQTRDETGEHTA